jgi:TonB family protein
VKKDKGRYHSIRKPKFIGGKKAFQAFLVEHLEYPEEALKNKVEGIVHVQCEISDRGKVLNVRVVHGLGFGLDEEAKRLCLIMPFEDTTERGLKIKHKKTIRIPFALPKQPELKISYQTTSTDNAPGGYNYTIKF